MSIELFDKRYIYLEWSDELEGKDCILAKTYQNLKDFVNSGDEGRIMKVNKGNEKPFTNHYVECDFCYYDPNLKVKRVWMNGEKIQMKIDDEWEDLEFKYDKEENYKIEWDENEWRVKPTEENEKHTPPHYGTYVLNMNKNGNFKLSISKYDVSNPIYFGDKEKCMYVMDMVSRNFVHNNEKCAECNGLYCHECKELKKFINNINFIRRMTNRELSEYLAKGNGEMKKSYSMINGIDFQTTVNIYHSYFETEGDDEVEKGILIRNFGSDKWREPLIEM